MEITRRPFQIAGRSPSQTAWWIDLICKCNQTNKREKWAIMPCFFNGQSHRAAPRWLWGRHRAWWVGKNAALVTGQKVTVTPSQLSYGLYKSKCVLYKGRHARGQINTHNAELCHVKTNVNVSAKHDANPTSVSCISNRLRQTCLHVRCGVGWGLWVMDTHSIICDA